MSCRTTFTTSGRGSGRWADNGTILLASGVFVDGIYALPGLIEFTERLPALRKPTMRKYRFSHLQV